MTQTTPMPSTHPDDFSASQTLYSGILTGPAIDAQQFHGTSEADVLAQIRTAFAAEALDNLPGVKVIHDHLDIEAQLRRLRLTPNRIEELAERIRSTTPDTLGTFSDLLTDQEVIRGYLGINTDENIEIARYQLDTITTLANRKPAAINVIHYDIESGMAIALEGLEHLVGYYQIGRTDTPHPDDYEWDNGFDFSFITPQQAEAISAAGFPDIVTRYDRMGAVCEG